MPTEPRLKVVFYKSQTGKEPVRDWLKELPLLDKKAIGEDIKTVQLAVGHAVDPETRARFVGSAFQYQRWHRTSVIHFSWRGNYTVARFYQEI